MNDWRCVIAFSRPPERFRFTRSASGKTWFRVIEGRQWAGELARQLSELDIHGVIKKSDPPKARKGKGPKAKFHPSPKASRLAIPEDASRGLRDLAKEVFERHKAETRSPQHTMATAPPEPINPPSFRRLGTNATQEILRRGSAKNGARRP